MAPLVCPEARGLVVNRDIRDAGGWDSTTEPGENTAIRSAQTLLARFNSSATPMANTSAKNVCPPALSCPVQL